jgi:hypothetical protein
VAKNGRVSPDPARRRPDGALSALLGEVNALRLTLDSDLTIAAAAADAERDDIAGDILDSDREELAAFAARAQLRLDGVDDSPAPAPAAAGRRLRVLGPVLVAASVAIALVIGAVGGASTSKQPTTRALGPNRLVSEQVTASYADLRRAADGGASPSLIVAAAKRLHRSLVPMLHNPSANPASVQRVLHMLAFETAVLENNPAAAHVLAQARALVARLAAQVKPTVVVALPSPSLLVVPQQDNQATSPTPSQAKTDKKATSTQTTKHTSKKPRTATPSSSPSPSPTPTPTPVWPFNLGGPRLP